jgi:hypothetical protein
MGEVYLPDFLLCWDEGQEQYYAFRAQTGETIYGASEVDAAPPPRPPLTSTRLGDKSLIIVSFHPFLVLFLSRVRRA